MMIFSGYLMYLLAFKIKAVCLYCSFCSLSLSLFTLALIGRDWHDINLFTDLWWESSCWLAPWVCMHVNNPVASTKGDYAITPLVLPKLPWHSI